MADNGKTARCPDWAPKSNASVHYQSRVSCLLQTKSYCPSCPHSKFKIEVQVDIGNQEVLCPQWSGETSRLNGALPLEYVPLARKTCLQDKPFIFCPSCPNSNPANPPKNIEGWFRDWKRERGF